MFSNNPIKLVADGKLMEFDGLEDFYLKVFQMLREDFPRGYIDYKLFLYEHTPLRGDALNECCKGIECSWADSENCCFKVHWTYPVQTRDRLTDFLRKASKSITNSYIDLYWFDKAWNTFHQSIENERQPP